MVASSEGGMNSVVHDYFQPVRIKWKCQNAGSGTIMYLRVVFPFPAGGVTTWTRDQPTTIRPLPERLPSALGTSVVARVYLFMRVAGRRS